MPVSVGPGATVALVAEAEVDVGVDPKPDVGPDAPAFPDPTPQPARSSEAVASRQAGRSRCKAQAILWVRTARYVTAS